jgi:hypothetical protein
MWIQNRDKYALVGLELKLEGASPAEQVGGELWALTGASFDVPTEWREWLGSIRAEEVAGCNLFLASKLASATPDILDGENQILEKRVWHFYVGLLLSAMFSPSHRPVLLTGARRNGVIGIRQHKDLDLPVPQVFRPYPAIFAADILSAARLGQQLGAIVACRRPGRALALLSHPAYLCRDARRRGFAGPDSSILPLYRRVDPSRHRQDETAVQEPHRAMHRAGTPRFDGRAIRHPQPCRTSP